MLQSIVIVGAEISRATLRFNDVFLAQINHPWTLDCGLDCDWTMDWTGLTLIKMATLIKTGVYRKCHHSYVQWLSPLPVEESFLKIIKVKCHIMYI